jgi:hypothetical protein
MAKAGVPKKAKPKLDDKEQSERFKQTAWELGVDASGELFDRALKRIIPSKDANNLDSKGRKS